MSDLKERLRVEADNMMFPDALEPCTMREAADRIEVLEGLLRSEAEYLRNQQDEPWPNGDFNDRLHYWRDKCITSARRIDAILSQGDE